LHNYYPNATILSLLLQWKKFKIAILREWDMEGYLPGCGPAESMIRIADLSYLGE